jgi:hypothetical protein
LFGRIGCSTFALLAQRTQSSGLICGRNLDYFVESAAGDDPWAATNYMKEHLAVIDYRPQGRAGFTTVGWPGFVGTVTAMSQRQMVVGSMTVATNRNWAVATPACFLYRRVMEEAGTLDAAIDILQRGRRSQGNNVLLGSGSEGDAAVVEYTPWRLAVRRPTEGWIASTNHFVHPRMARYHGPYAHQSSSERFERLADLCGGGPEGPVSADEAQQFLADVTRRTPDSTEYCSVSNPCTVYSTVFAPAQGRMWVRATEVPGRSFEELES